MQNLRRRQLLLAGGSLVALRAARAQTKDVTRLGVLAPIAPMGANFWQPFSAALRERGWNEGSRFVVEQRGTGRDPQRAEQYAMELADSRVDLILALGTQAALAAKHASPKIPVVTWCGYAVEPGLAKTFSMPGGNVTGVSTYANAQLWSKFPQLLRELQPWTQRIGAIWDYLPPAFPDGEVGLKELNDAASRLGLQTRTWKVTSEDDLGVALASMPREKLEGLIVCSAGMLIQQRGIPARVAEVVRKLRIPAITDLGTASFRSIGCVLAYSPNMKSVTDRIANHVDRVLRGERPGERPFESPTRFDLVVNSGAANALGITVPPLLLARADQIID